MTASTIGSTSSAASTKSPTRFEIFDALATFARPFSTRSLMNICRLVGSSSSAATSTSKRIPCSASRASVSVFTYAATSSAVSSPFLRLSYAAFQSLCDVERPGGCRFAHSVAGGSPGFGEVSGDLARAAGRRGASDVACWPRGADVAGAACPGGRASAFVKGCQAGECEDFLAVQGSAYLVLMLRARRALRALVSRPAASRPPASRTRHGLPASTGS